MTRKCVLLLVIDCNDKQFIDPKNFLWVNILNLKFLKMKRIITLIFIYSIALDINQAQRLRPFQIIEFSGLNPDWAVPVKDTVLAENSTVSFIDEYNSISASGFLPD